jgi:regulator of PEP synthase PpsR (kinase-PPPase family)
VLRITTTSARLAQVRHERRPHSDYASLPQCARELRRAETLYRSHSIPMINFSAKSVEEMSTVILQALKDR